MRFSTGIEEYVKWKNPRGVRFRDKEHLVALRNLIGDRTLRSVTALQVLGFLDGKQLSAATWWRQYKVIRSFFEFWLLRGEVKRVPMPRPRLAWPEPFKPHIYSRDELRRLLKATQSFVIGHWARIDPLTLRTLILFLYGTGARPREVISLRIDSFDFRQRLVTLGDRAVGRARTIPFGLTLKKHLLSYVKMRKGGVRYVSQVFSGSERQTGGGKHSTRDLPALEETRRSPTVWGWKPSRISRSSPHIRSAPNYGTA